jgi:hypothetical protein
MISIALCVVIYALVGFAVSSNLSLPEIIETQDYSLAAAARPALVKAGVAFTVVLAMLATAGGIIASVFAVSRMLAILLDAIVLLGFIWVNATSDPLVRMVASVEMVIILLGEWLFLSKRDTSDESEHSHHFH